MNKAKNLTAATIGNGTAVHAVRYDENDKTYGLVNIVNGNKYAATTLCGQVSAGKGYRTRTNGAIETEVTCTKCIKKLA